MNCPTCNRQMECEHCDAEYQWRLHGGLILIDGAVGAANVAPLGSQCEDEL